MRASASPGAPADEQAAVKSSKFRGAITPAELAELADIPISAAQHVLQHSTEVAQLRHRQVGRRLFCGRGICYADGGSVIVLLTSL